MAATPVPAHLSAVSFGNLMSLSAATAVANGSIGAAAAASSSVPAVPNLLTGPLPSRKTISITFAPNWNQEAVKSPLRAMCFCVLLGPPGVTPANAEWRLEFNLYSTDRTPSVVRTREEQQIAKTDRAILWHAGGLATAKDDAAAAAAAAAAVMSDDSDGDTASGGGGGGDSKSSKDKSRHGAWPKYKHALVLAHNACRIPSGAGSDLKTHSVVLRCHPTEKETNALIWVPKRMGTKRRKDLSYIKVLQSHQYLLNVTFDVGSNIATLVGQSAWRPVIWCYVKKTKKGEDFILKSTAFTNFTTTWADKTEAEPAADEIKESNQAEREDAADEDPKAAAAAAAASAAVAATSSTALAKQKAATAPAATSAASNSLPLPLSASGSAAAAAAASPHPKSAPNSLTGALAAAAAAHPHPHPHPSANLTIKSRTAGAADIITPLQCATAWTEMEKAFATHPAENIQMPDTDERARAGVARYPVSAVVEKFVPHDNEKLSCLLNGMESFAKSCAADTTSPAYVHASYLRNFLGASSQLLGWQHVQNFIADPASYQAEEDRKKLIAAAPVSGASAAAALLLPPLPPLSASVNGASKPGLIDLLILRGESLMRRYYERMWWAFERQTGAGAAFSGELYLKILASDRPWMNDSSRWQSDAETAIKGMMEQNKQKYDSFREYQLKGVNWPHSNSLRVIIESCGWSYRPMMIKRDRCVCDACGVEVIGWRFWSNPYLLHDLNSVKHTPALQAKLNDAMRALAADAKASQLTVVKAEPLSNAAATAAAAAAAATAAAAAVAATAVGPIGIVPNTPKSPIAPLSPSRYPLPGGGAYPFPSPQHALSPYSMMDGGASTVSALSMSSNSTGGSTPTPYAGGAGFDTPIAFAPLSPAAAGSASSLRVTSPAAARLVSPPPQHH